MKLLAIVLLAAITLPSSTTNVYDFNLRKLDSETVLDLKQYKGKKILFVNVASKCGYTSQYADLEKLYQEYQDQLVIIGLPCNQFMGQEPGSETEIAKFCSTTYGVTFPMTEKIDVKGSNQHPLYQWLTKKELNAMGNFTVSWNFNKFLVDENGKLLAHFGSGTKPLSSDITDYLK